MSTVTIELSNRLLANSLALWFENGNAIEAFKDSQDYQVIESLREDGEDIPELDLYPTVIFDGDDEDVDHTIILNTME